MADWRELAGDQNLRLSTKLLEQQDEINRLNDENRDLRAAVARAEQTTTRVRARLADHYLAQMVCDHERGLDNPICACSLVHLGWHPSVGAAVAAWIEHALAADVPAAATEEETPTPQCDGLCVTGADVGVPEYSGVAYAHPGCQLHGGGIRCECGQPDRCNSYTHDPNWKPAPALRPGTVDHLRRNGAARTEEGS